MAIAFLAEAGGSLTVTHEDAAAAGNRLLTPYLTDVLLLEDKCLGSAALRRAAKLCHVDALRGALHSMTAADPFAAVDSRYKQPLPPAAVQALTAAVSSASAGSSVLDTAVLLPLLKGFITEHLTSEHMSPKSDIYECLAYLALPNSSSNGSSASSSSSDALVLDEVDWFVQCWPQGFLYVSCAVETYKLLAQLHQSRTVLL
jgi:hypothetical protein